MQNNPSLQVMAKIAAPLDSNIEYLLGEEHLPKIHADETLDEEWRSIIKEAVEEGMSKGDFQALKDLIRSNIWKNGRANTNGYSSDQKNSSNIIILHIDN